jgi:DNA polymerase
MALLEGIPPGQIIWLSAHQSNFDLFSKTSPLPPERARAMPGDTLRVPKNYVELMRAVLCHSDPERFALLYEALWRLQDNKHVLQDRSSGLVSRLHAMAKSVRRDCHKMTAFVRFRELSIPDGDTETASRIRRFYAWFEPDHWIVERTAPFFADRFGDMNWIIETPKGCACLNDSELSCSHGVAQPRIVKDDTAELWNTYYRNIFNPARLKVKAMQSEMPKKYWHNMPETALIPEMIATAQSRSEKMRMDAATQPPVRARKIRAMVEQREAFEATRINSDIAAGGLTALRQQASNCTRCPIHCNATQTVFGEGPSNAALMLVGEQPGDHEDLSGRPFVGPAGRLLGELLAESGIDPTEAYLTNAVKHFKFAPRGKLRLHKSPARSEISQCKWWLEAERAVVRPMVMVALGSTAAFALTGNGSDIWKRRGTVEMLGDDTALVITLHPSAILRMPSSQAGQARHSLLSDLRLAKSLLPEVMPTHADASSNGAKLGPV